MASDSTDGWKLSPGGSYWIHNKLRRWSVYLDGSIEPYCKTPDVETSKRLAEAMHEFAEQWLEDHKAKAEHCETHFLKHVAFVPFDPTWAALEVPGGLSIDAPPESAPTCTKCNGTGEVPGGWIVPGMSHPCECQR